MKKLSGYCTSGLCLGKDGRSCGINKLDKCGLQCEFWQNQATRIGCKISIEYTVWPLLAAMSKFIFAALILSGMAVVFVACRKPSASLQVGGIYSIADGDGWYGVVKLLVFEDDFARHHEDKTIQSRGSNTG